MKGLFAFIRHNQQTLFMSLRLLDHKCERGKGPAGKDGTCVSPLYCRKPYTNPDKQIIRITHIFADSGVICRRKSFQRLDYVMLNAQ